MSAPLFTAEDRASLRGCPLFRDLSDQTIDRVVNRARMAKYARGHLVFAQGDPANAFFIVLEGWVKLYRLTANGDEAVVTVVARGESFAEPVMFLGGRYPVYASAATPCRLLRMEYDAFVSCLESERDVATAMLASIAWRAAALTEQIGILKVLNAPRRVAEFLLSLCPLERNDARIPLPYEKALIAARLGMTPESFSRALAALRKFGVKVARDVITIDDIGALRDYMRVN